MNSEDAVIAAIDKLIDAQLERGPRDDYTVDRYPRCDDCNHAWHGVGCVYCDCPGQNGEPGGEQPPFTVSGTDLDRVEIIGVGGFVERYYDEPVSIGMDGVPGGYTLSQLAAMRWNSHIEAIYLAQLDPEHPCTGLQ